MTRKIVWTNLAVKKFEEIFYYLQSQYSDVVALAFLDRVE